MRLNHNIIIGLLLLSFSTKAQIISTFAGNGSATNNGDNGPAISAGVNYPIGGAFDKTGNYYCAEGIVGHRIRKVSVSGIISTIAGTGVPGFSGDNDLAVSATLNNPEAVTTDTVGNIYIADASNNRIRKVDITTGIITTVAGTGVGGYNGDNILALNAQLSDPIDICFDKLGNLYIADAANARVRKVSTSGIITTVAGNGIPGHGNTGVPATSVSINVWSICIDDAGNLYIADGYARVYKMNTDGIITYFVGNGINGYGGDNTLAINATTAPFYVKADHYGNFFIAEYQQNRIRRVNIAGYINTIVGDGFAGYHGDSGYIDTAEINYPSGIALDSCDNLYIADSRNYRIRKITYPKCNYLAVEDMPVEQGVSIYPNPVYNTLSISTKEINKVSITNLIGQTILTKQYNSAEKAEIDVQNLPAGMYFVKINDGMVQKFVKE